VLYDEDPSSPQGRQYVGSVVWRAEPVKVSGLTKAFILLCKKLRSKEMDCRVKPGNDEMGNNG
jgi:hypothetical protein